MGDFRRQGWQEVEFSAVEALELKRLCGIPLVVSESSPFQVTLTMRYSARIWPIDPLPDAIAHMPRDLAKTERTRYQIGPSEPRMVK